MLKATEAAVETKTKKEAASDIEEIKPTRRRGRPPKKKSTNRKRGRPKGSTSKNKTAIKDRDVKTALRERIKQMRGEMRSAKLQFKEAIRNEKNQVKEIRKELKETLRREQALLKLFELKEKAVSTYADRWTSEQIKKIQSPSKKRRRRKKAS